MKKILITGLIVLFFILPTFAYAVNTESNTNAIKIKQPISGDNQTTLAIQQIHGGPWGIISATWVNNGSTTAYDVFWKMIVTGGFYGNINRSEAWGAIYTPPHSLTYFTLHRIYGLGKITIVIVVRALNAPEVSKTATAVIIGPFIYVEK